MDDHAPSFSKNISPVYATIFNDQLLDRDTGPKLNITLYDLLEKSPVNRRPHANELGPQLISQYPQPYTPVGKHTCACAPTHSQAIGRASGRKRVCQYE